LDSFEEFRNCFLDVTNLDFATGFILVIDVPSRGSNNSLFSIFRAKLDAKGNTLEFP